MQKFKYRHKNGKRRIRTIAYVVHNGHPIELSKCAMQYFISLLHKEVSLDYADFKPIYSEHFIRYHERREKDVLEALETLYRLYGYVDTRHRKKINGNNVIDIYRARLRINNAEIHIKT
ncbi:MAG TPA: hypothetical protein ENI59_00830, partial [Euryarchaeota archaeon]|nr:hypothetical protein [Euryarchaeota archaeon]